VYAYANISFVAVDAILLTLILTAFAGFYAIVS